MIDMTEIAGTMVADTAGLAAQRYVINASPLIRRVKLNKCNGLTLLIGK